jgi:hypothetical protein
MNGAFSFLSPRWMCGYAVAAAGPVHGVCRTQSRHAGRKQRMCVHAAAHGMVRAEGLRAEFLAWTLSSATAERVGPAADVRGARRGAGIGDLTARARCPATCGATTTAKKTMKSAVPLVDMPPRIIKPASRQAGPG